MSLLDRILAIVPKDKLEHFGIGFSVVAFTLVLWSLAEFIGLTHTADMGAAAALAGIVCGVTKEGCDWLDNRITPGMHGVEFWDAFATALPGLLTLGLWHLAGWA
jgi:hypothetical protein